MLCINSFHSSHSTREFRIYILLLNNFCLPYFPLNILLVLSSNIHSYKYEKKETHKGTCPIQSYHNTFMLSSNAISSRILLISLLTLTIKFQFPISITNKTYTLILTFFAIRPTF